MSESGHQDSEIIQFDSKQDAAELALELAQLAKREICFFGSNIDPVLFDSIAMAMVVKDFLRSSAKCQLKMVVHDTRQNIAQGHRLLPLFEKMSSRCDLRQTDEQHQDQRDFFLLVDNKAWLHCHSHGRYAGSASMNEPTHGRLLSQRFEQLFNHGSPDMHSRRLHI
ncbi:MAG: hypothetical protein JJU48_09100 [Methylophaga sp.]|nr:hypothetical protein [Methylophaga sp.]